MATGSRASFEGQDEALLRAARAKGRCPKTGAHNRRTALEVLAASEPARSRSSAATVVAALLVVAFVVLMFSLAGCATAPAADQAAFETSKNAGDAKDETLPFEARAVGADNMRAWEAQYFTLTGDHLPLPVLPPELAPVDAPAAPRAQDPPDDRRLHPCPFCTDPGCDEPCNACCDGHCLCHSPSAR